MPSRPSSAWPCTPLLVVVAALIGGWAGLLTAGHYVVASTMGVLVAATGAVLARYRPGTLRGLTTAATGQAFRVLVYRPRWDTACHAAHLAPRIGTATHTPGLVRHTRTANGIDVLLVRMAPGQTLLTWRDASASLAATFTAHAVTVRETGRPGWVLLDVLRRDPLAQEIVAPDPDAAEQANAPKAMGETRLTAADLDAEAAHLRAARTDAALDEGVRTGEVAR